MLNVSFLRDRFLYVVVGTNRVSSKDEVVGNAPIVKDVDAVCLKVAHVNPIH
jgi:hypothetical protein